MMNERASTSSFAPFEWMLARRYLRARRKEGFISVIAGFSFLGIMLGVATLIIVMAVMNGFRKELLDKILGLNGHLLVQPIDSPLTDWEAVADRISKVQGIRLAAPIVEGQALASSPYNASGVLVRGIRSADLEKLTSIANNIKQGSLEGFDEGEGVAIGRRLADQLTVRAGDNVTHQGLQDRRCVRDRHVRIRLRLCLHAAEGIAGLLQPRWRRHFDRGLHRRSRRSGSLSQAGE
jgi:lipoprotein-releasing system permease protein